MAKQSNPYMRENRTRHFCIYSDKIYRVKTKIY